MIKRNFSNRLICPKFLIEKFNKLAHEWIEAEIKHGRNSKEKKEVKRKIDLFMEWFNE